MSAFDSGGPEIPPTPIDIPTPDFPDANFAFIGQQFEQGRQAAQAAAKAAPGWLDWIADLVAKIIGALLGLVLQVVAYLLNLVFKVWNNAEGGTDQVAATAVSGMFGVPVSAAAFQSVANPAQRQELSAQLAGVIVTALGGDFTGANAQPLGPSHAGADKFLTTTTHMAIEGWLQGWIFEVVSAGQVETFAELKDIMEKTLGLGRLARRVLGPPIKTLVEDPFTWLLNSTYRPTLLQPEALVRQFLRGLIDRATLDTVMSWHGYSADKVEALININKVHLSLGQLETLTLQGNIQDSDAISALQAQGYDEATANSALFAARAARIDAWSRELVNAAMAAYVSRRMDAGTWSTYVNNSGLPSAEKAYINLLADLKLGENTKRVSFGEAQQLVENGIWGLDQFEALALAEGYSIQDEQDMELLLLLKMKKASDAASAKAQVAATRAAKQKLADEKAAAKLAGAAAAAESKGVSVAQFTTLVKDGIKTVGDFSTFLAEKGLAADNVTALTQALQLTLQKTTAAGGTRATAAGTLKAKNLTLSQLEQATKAGILTTNEFSTRVQDAGVSAEDAAILVELLTDEMQTAAAKASAVAAAKAKAAVKHVSLAAEERGVQLGLQTMAQYSAFLDAHGFAPEDRDLLVSELQAKVGTTSAVVAAKAAALPGTSTKELSLSQLARAVRAGESPISDYTAALATHGYDAHSQTVLTDLLTMLMEHDQATLAAKGAAGALLTQHGLSLADLERAVKLGVVPVSVYTDALGRAGVSTADANTLTLSLAASIKSTATAKTTKASASALLAQVGLSLPAIEKDVLAGKLTVDQLATVLSGAGITAADVAAITGLVSDQLANQQAILALTASATARAAAKNLSLAEEEAAVKKGVLTISDYSAFVAGLGFDPADVQTLTATLQASLPAPAAPEPAAPAAPAPAAPAP